MATTNVAESEDFVSATLDGVNEVIEDVVRAGGGSTNVLAIIQGLNDPSSGMYSSIKGTDFKTRKEIASAVTTSVPVDDNLGVTIMLVNYLVTPVDLVDDDGTVNTAPRVVLIDSDGKAYHATSVGLLSALRSINNILGEPSTWPEPVSIKVVSERGRNGYKYFTIKFV